MIEPDDDEGSLAVPVVLALAILFTLFGAVIGFTQERSDAVEIGESVGSVAK